LFYSGHDTRTVHDKNNEAQKEILKDEMDREFFNKNANSNQEQQFLYNNENYLKYYIDISIGSVRYFLEKPNEEKLIQIGSKGNPVTKHFKKSVNEYFKDCPDLVLKISAKEFKIDDLPEIIEYYKNNCF
jgi:hypothetical protein